uniref:Uncharacterized protein n=1 Tax=Solanum lycopersicum TaxID=4081 RepID=A0A3Q7HI43_SOLLC
MTSTVDAAGNPNPDVDGVDAGAKIRRFSGREVDRCVPIMCRLKDLNQKCTKEMDAYAGCMYYNTNEFNMCRKEQKEFEEACPC